MTINLTRCKVGRCIIHFQDISGAVCFCSSADCNNNADPIAYAAAQEEDDNNDNDDGSGSGSGSGSDEDAESTTEESMDNMGAKASVSLASLIFSICVALM